MDNRARWVLLANNCSLSEPCSDPVQVLIADTLWDLPPVGNYSFAERGEYLSEPISPFQAWIRRDPPSWQACTHLTFAIDMPYTACVLCIAGMTWADDLQLTRLCCDTQHLSLPVCCTRVLILAL